MTFNKIFALLVKEYRNEAKNSRCSFLSRIIKVLLSHDVVKTLNENLLETLTLFHVQNWGVAIGGDRRLLPFHFNFRTKQGPTVSVSNIRCIVFTDQKFHAFAVYTTIFRQFTAAFHFF